MIHRTDRSQLAWLVVNDDEGGVLRSDEMVRKWVANRRTGHWTITFLSCRECDHPTDRSGVLTGDFSRMPFPH